MLRWTALERAARAANAVATRIKNAEFPVLKDCATDDFSVLPQRSQPKILELGRCEWIEQKSHGGRGGTSGTGKTRLAVGWGQAACRAGPRVRFVTAAERVRRLEKEQKRYTRDRFLGPLDRAHRLIRDALGHVTLSRGGVELLFRVFADRHERGSIRITSNLPLSDGVQIFQGERMTAALRDRLGHRCHSFAMKGESDRFRASMKSKKGRRAECGGRCRSCPERPSSGARGSKLRAQEGSNLRAQYQGPSKNKFHAFW